MRSLVRLVRIVWENGTVRDSTSLWTGPVSRHVVSYCGWCGLQAAQPGNPTRLPLLGSNVSHRPTRTEATIPKDDSTPLPSPVRHPYSDPRVFRAGLVNKSVPIRGHKHAGSYPTFLTGFQRFSSSLAQRGVRPRPASVRGKLEVVDPTNARRSSGISPDAGRFPNRPGSSSRVAESAGVDDKVAFLHVFRPDSMLRTSVFARKVLLQVWNGSFVVLLYADELSTSVSSCLCVCAQVQIPCIFSIGGWRFPEQWGVSHVSNNAGPAIEALTPSPK